MVSGRLLINLTGILLLIMSVGCHDTQSDSSFTISGTLKGGADQRIYLRKMTQDSLKSVDSAVIDNNGHFTLQGKTELPRFYRLTIPSSKPIILIIDQQEHLQIQATLSHFSKTYRVKHSKGSRLVRNLTSRLHQAKERIDSLGEVFRQNRKNPQLKRIKDTLDTLYKATIDSTRVFLVRFVRQNSGSLASLMALQQHLQPGQRILEPAKYLNLYQQVDSALMSQYPDYAPVKQFHETVRSWENRIPEKGDTLWLNGDTISAGWEPTILHNRQGCLAKIAYRKTGQYMSGNEELIYKIRLGEHQVRL